MPAGMSVAIVAFAIVLIGVSLVIVRHKGRNDEGKQAHFSKYRIAYNIRTRHPSVMMEKIKGGKIASIKLTSSNKGRKSVKPLRKNPERGNKGKAYYVEKISREKASSYRWFKRFRKWKLCGKDRRELNRHYLSKKEKGGPDLW